jgi:hypothetical protein
MTGVFLRAEVLALGWVLPQIALGLPVESGLRPALFS